jgi:hypothetical protein
MEDLSKSEYLVRRQAIEEQLERTGMPLDPRIDKAEEILAEFGQKFWDDETEVAGVGWLSRSWRAFRRTGTTCRL